MSPNIHCHPVDKGNLKQAVQSVSEEFKYRNQDKAPTVEEGGFFCFFSGSEHIQIDFKDICMVIIMESFQQQG